MQYHNKSVLVPVEKYERLIHSTSTHHQMGSGYEADTEEDHDPHRLDMNVIVSTLPKQSRQKIQAILRLITEDPQQRLSWDAKGQLVYQGRVIHGSHITDLLKDSQYMYKHFEPKGKDEFYQGLKDLNVPYTLLCNLKRIDGVVTAKDFHNLRRPIPPGIPDKVDKEKKKVTMKKKKKKISYKWISL